MKKTLLYSGMVAAALMFAGCGASSSGGGDDPVDDTADSIVGQLQGGNLVLDYATDSTVDQEAGYRLYYMGGTQINDIMIAGSTGKLCTLAVLPSTTAWNEYSDYAFLVNGEEGTADTYTAQNADGDVVFTVAWMYYTAENSYLDFNVTCTDIPSVPANTITVDSLAALFGINPDDYTADTDVFYKNTSIADYYTIEYTNPQGAVTDASWYGLLLTHYDSDNNTTEVDHISSDDLSGVPSRIVCKALETHAIECNFYDAADYVIHSITKSGLANGEDKIRLSGISISGDGTTLSTNLGYTTKLRVP
ncbi:hypothetical protein ACXWTF_13200 [Thiomicrolovo sp. ZZH C-3]